MKKTVKKALALSMTAALFMTACSQKAAETPPATAGGDTGTAATEAAAAATEGKSKAERPVAGMTCYMYSDTHIANVRNTVLKAAETGTVSVETSDSQFDVGLQMNAMDAFVTKGCKYLVINNINTNAKDQVIDVARKADLPIIFWNTDLLRTKRWILTAPAISSALRPSSPVSCRERLRQNTGKSIRRQTAMETARWITSC